MAPAYDVLLISDLRLPGPTGRAIAAEIQAQAEAGYRTALLHVRSALLARPHPIQPLIRAAIEQGLADWLDPDADLSAHLAVVHHPGVLSEAPARAPRLAAGRKLLVVNHPLSDAQGRPWLDRRSLVRNLEDLLGEGAHLAPAGPQIRAQLVAAGWPLPLLDQDWPPVLDPGTMAVPMRRAWSGRLVIGRHGELDRLAWPLPRPLLLAAYPEEADLEVRVLADRARLAALLGELPANWTVVDPGTASVADFLAGLDAWVHLSADAAQPVRLEILEALASGVPTVLPAALRETFGDAAAYAEADGLRAAIRGLERPSTRAVLAQRASDLIARRFSPRAHVERLRALIGPPAPTRSLHLRREQRPRRRVLFVADGAGLGPLTRLLAVARRCPPSIEPVFLALSEAAGVVDDFGYLVEFTARQPDLALPAERWNQALRAQLREMIAFYDARALLFDGSLPDPGLIEARSDHPGLPFVWCRPGPRRPGAPDHACHFDAVLEPRDLAEPGDRGETGHHDRRRRVEPILLLDRGELMDPLAARAGLGLDPERPAILIRLGAGGDRDDRELVEIAHRHLRQRFDVQIALARWPMAGAAARPPSAGPAAADLPPDVVRLQIYPLARYFRAFDGAISAAGYTSWHELIHHGLPGIFVPDEGRSTDDQLARARFAERRGLGLCVRRAEPYRVRAAIDRLMDPDQRRRLSQGARAIEAGNGARAAAELLEEMVLGLPAGVPPAPGGSLHAASDAGQDTGSAQVRKSGGQGLTPTRRRG